MRISNVTRLVVISALAASLTGCSGDGSKDGSSTTSSSSVSGTATSPSRTASSGAAGTVGKPVTLKKAEPFTTASGVEYSLVGVEVAKDKKSYVAEVKVCVKDTKNKLEPAQLFGRAGWVLLDDQTNVLVAKEASKAKVDAKDKTCANGQLAFPLSQKDAKTGKPVMMTYTSGTGAARWVLK